jgi:hypothetical protein
VPVRSAVSTLDATVDAVILRSRSGLALMGVAQDAERRFGARSLSPSRASSP